MSRYDHVTLLTLPVICTLIILIASFLYGDIPDIVIYIPFIISALFLGLPHGGVDHIVPKMIDSKYTSSQIIVLYLVLMTLYLTLWYFNPILSAVIFIVVTWVHWGQGDLYVYVSVLNANHIVSPLQKVLHTIIRGALPMFVPLYFYRNRYEEILESMSGMVTENTELAIEPSLVFYTSILLISLTVVYFIISSYRLFNLEWQGIHILLIDIAEIVLLSAYFATVPPVLAIGVYFCIWHSLRHIVRIISIDSKMSANFTVKNFIIDMIQFIRKSVLTTLVSLAVIIGIFIYLSQGDYEVLRMLSVYLIVISVLTPPHFLVVLLMDRKDNIW